MTNTTNDRLNEEEHIIKRELDKLYKSYMVASKPYIDRLVSIEKMRINPTKIILTSNITKEERVQIIELLKASGVI